MADEQLDIPGQDRASTIRRGKEEEKKESGAAKGQTGGENVTVD
jgi:hypothetical protein